MASTHGYTADKLTHVLYVGRATEQEAAPEVLIDRLKKALTEYILSPSFESYGNFVIHFSDAKNGRPRVSFFGNFYNFSLVFRIDINDQDLITELTRLIRANQSTQAYIEAKKEYEKHETIQEHLRGF